MQNKPRSFRFSIFSTTTKCFKVFCFFFFASYSFCGSKNYPPEYLAAVRDAQQVSSAKISKHLMPLTADTVKVVAWVNKTSYCVSPGKLNVKDFPAEIDCTQDLWVTPADEVTSFCHTLSQFQGDKILRLKKRMGLPPDYDVTHFVEFEVSRSSIIRPCPDSEVDDTQCSIEFPNTVLPDQKKWFHDTEKNANEYPYPWTRLGYTYDWGSDDHVGFSEYVVHPTKLKVLRHPIENSNYCQ